MHLVFYNNFYSSFQEAASKTDGLAVVGVFLQVLNISSIRTLKSLNFQLKGTAKKVFYPESVIFIIWTMA